MRAVIQRVKRASVTVEGKTVGEIGNGMLVLLGVTHDDDESDIRYTAQKILNLRIFRDSQGKMNRSVLDIAGELLVVSQFTLYGTTAKGRRPSFDRAAGGEFAETLYTRFVEYCRLYVSVATGLFGAYMDVSLVNDGPVTLILDSKDRRS